MEYSEIFIPVPSHLQTANAAKSAERMGNSLKFGVKGFEWEWLGGFKIALVGLRKSGVPNSFSSLREELYALFTPSKVAPVIDLGDIELPSIDDAVCEKVAYVLQRIFAEGVFPIVFSENMYNAECVYSAVKSQHKNVAATFVLPHANLGSAQEPLSSENILAHIMSDYGRELSTLNVVGYQNYLTSPSDVKALSKQYCELLRLGAVRDNVLSAEPLLRDADVLCAGVNAVRQCDAPAAVGVSPNGLYAEEMCRLLRYASFSDKLKACYLGSFNLANDAQRQTAKLVAQLIWHVVEGFAYRVGDAPTKSKICRRHRVQIGKEQHILFYQSKATDRWWMAVPVDGTQHEEVPIPCLREDYNKAAHGEIPDRWLWFYKKLSVR